MRRIARLEKRVDGAIGVIAAVVDKLAECATGINRNTNRSSAAFMGLLSHLGVTGEQMEDGSIRYTKTPPAPKPKKAKGGK